ncbi:cytochrome C biogenesis protein [Anaerobacillus alkaliphilus]|uniref:Cytochrome C biogenesis protein n=1 Tax=Anaerobacillus alkaliphilus TaxID=1548597 RepID=A0A4Q0VXI2_9BACI|nr:cytochrome c biogenesis protein ResB [Anaerobacillus alkaliphilus]RXJ03876.1 cytochrome C biogenesis protein [Anaerobacillus alkaliphilus]
MEKVKCECGHVNPYGTVICESCGKPFFDEEKGLLNMRYEGVARRSQTYNKTIIDKIWNFFSSVKVGIWIIIVTLVASSVGTIFPQQFYIPPGANPSIFYQEEYGILGQLYYSFGFHDLYNSWWYMLLIASLGVSLIICSLDRVVPLHRALKTQRVTRHESFLQRQRVHGVSKVDNLDATIEESKQLLQKKKYNISEENGNIVAEKGRFSRWGPYVNHIGLIIFLIGCMLRFFPGMYVDDNIWVREGETVVVRGTDGEFFLRNDRFMVEFYDDTDERFREALMRVGSPVVKTYQTSATLFQRVDDGVVGKEPELVEIARHDIKVNDPFKFHGYALYQYAFKQNEISQMSFELEENATGNRFGRIDVSTYDPNSIYDLGNGYLIEIIEYFPDFYFDDNRTPSSQSRIPNNPAFIFKMISPDKPEGEISFVGIQTNQDIGGENTHRMRFVDIEMNHVTNLVVRKDYTLGLLFVGGFIFMVGLIQGMYWTHRRIWIQKVNDELWISAHTNKNWFGLKKDIEIVVNSTQLTMPIDKVEEEEKKM